jgi:hypothetical protein
MGLGLFGAMAPLQSKGGPAPAPRSGRWAGVAAGAAEPRRRRRAIAPNEFSFSAKFFWEFKAFLEIAESLPETPPAVLILKSSAVLVFSAAPIF